MLRNITPKSIPSKTMPAPPSIKPKPTLNGVGVGTKNAKNMMD